MRVSQSFQITLRDVPADAETPGHRLLLRAGFIRKVSAGVYNYLPLGLRVLNKVRQIVREEQEKIGCVELLMPTLVPFELLRETGRDSVEVLYKTTDRSLREFALGFTHEEVITDIVRNCVQSYRQMPLSLFQIQTKFRDEPRPRAGLIRGKEFIMSDAYSFDVDDEASRTYYDRFGEAYSEMFRRMDLPVLRCHAESGDIGGGTSQEFMVVSESGEDTVLKDEKTGEASNAERCDVGGSFPVAEFVGVAALEIVDTPGAKTIQDVTAFLKMTADRLVKSLLVLADGKPYAILIRGDRELNEFKLARKLGVSRVEMMDAARVTKLTGADVGFAGPVGLQDCEIIADQEIATLQDFVVGANQTDKHMLHVCHGRDFQVSRFEDVRVAVDGDSSVSGGVMREVRGIEVGHIFQLGTKYSDAMGATFTDKEGAVKPCVMGCYGLGIGRSMQAIAEGHHDENGLLWPVSVAPFEVIVIPANAQDEAQMTAANHIYDELLAAGIEAMFDDRDERAGAKFKDADLIGYPWRIVCGRGTANGIAEIKKRDATESLEMTVETAAEFVCRQIKKDRDWLS